MNKPANSNPAAMATLVTVFFFWGFVAASNGVFIPFCKQHFKLSQFQSQLIDTAFYAAYFVGPLLMWLYTLVTGKDILNRIGYKKGIVVGLLISIGGALLMLAAVNVGSFAFILSSFFVIALGFSLQQTAAQPLMVSLGTPETGAHRLNLGGGVNSFGTLIGPLLVSLILFGAVGNGTHASLQSIDRLYWLLIGIFVIATLFLVFTKLPDTRSGEPVEPGAGPFSSPHFIWGMLAIFVYVGVEVTVQSNLGALLKTKEYGGFSESMISPFISLYWGSLMVGRWTGALSVFNLKKETRLILTIVVPLVAFGVVLLSNIIKGNEVDAMFWYIIPVLILIGGVLVAKERPARMLLVFSLFGALAMLTGLLTKGDLSIYAFISGGLACSIGWPCIFAMSIAGLGKSTAQGSMFLIMMILGGALIPPLQGFIADQTNILSSYWLTVPLFLYLAWFSQKAKRSLRKQGIFVDEKTLAPVLAEEILEQ